MKTKLNLFLAILIIIPLIFTLTNCSRQSKDVGSLDNPIRFYFMPKKDKAVFDKYAPRIEKFIEANTDLAVETVYADNFISIIEAFNMSKADIAFMNTLGYLMARDWSDAHAYLQYLYEGEKSYKGAFIARKDSGLTSIKDVNGKAIAFADPFSSAGYLYPLKTIEENSIKPSKVVFAEGHRNAVEMVYNGKADVAASYYSKPNKKGQPEDARISILNKHPDALQKLGIIGYTTEIPNGPVAISNKISAEVRVKLIGALMEFARTDEGKQTLYNLYNINGFALVKDTDYNAVQNVLKTLGKSSEQLTKGGVSFYNKEIVSSGLAVQ